VRFPGISAELVRTLEITGNLNGCNNYFAKFCSGRRGTEVTEENLTTEGTEEPQSKILWEFPSVITLSPLWLSFLPVPPIYHAFDAIPQVGHVEIDQ